VHRRIQQLQQTSTRVRRGILELAEPDDLVVAQRWVSPQERAETFGDSLVESIFPARLTSGKRNELVALSSDTCDDLLQRMASYRGAVNVVVGEDSSVFDVVLFHRSHEHSIQAVPTCNDSCEVDETSELGLLVAFL